MAANPTAPGVPVSTDELEAVGRRLDAHHEAVQTGCVAICAVCRVSTDDGFVTGLRHDPQVEEMPDARRYLALFEAVSGSPEAR